MLTWARVKNAVRMRAFPASGANLPVPPQSRFQSFVPLDQRSENVSSGSNHYDRTKEITEFWLSGSLRICIYGACLKWLLPELSFSDRWSRGTKLWERDWCLPQRIYTRYQNKLDSGREIQKSKLHTKKISLEFHEHKVY